MNALVVGLAFLLGSVLGGQLLGALRGVDLRRTGSGNLGATNALRSGGIKLGLAVLVIDAAKAWIAVSYLPLLGEPTASLPWACGTAAVLGHIYSPWAGFKGGKGVATGLGSYIALLPMALLVGLAGFVPVMLLTGYVSLSVLIACALILLYVTCFAASGIYSYAGAYAVGMLLLLTWTHRENIKRLIQGNESRFTKVMLFKPAP